LKELFTNKGKSLSCKSVNSAKTEKTHGHIKSPVQGNDQISPSPGMMHGQMPGACRGEGGDVEVSI